MSQRLRRIGIVLFLVAIVGALAAILHDSSPPALSDTDGEASSDPIGEQTGGTASTTSETESIDTGSLTSRRDPFAADRLALYVAQVDEVDRCIDPTGTGLILTDAKTGRRYEATVQEGGAAVFEGVEVSSVAREFRISSALPDHGCFPDTVSLSRSDFAGTPPKGGVSLALIHIHELSGVVRDADTGTPIEGASVSLDSFTRSTSTSDADGRYSVNLNEPAGTLLAVADGYHGTFWHFPDIGADGSTTLPSQRDFVLRRDRITSYVNIHAVLGDAPAAGASLRVTEIAALPIPDDALRRIPANQRPRLLEGLEQELDGMGRVTGIGDLIPQGLDDEGRATLRVVTPTRLRVVVSDEESVAETTVDVQAGARRDVHLSLEAGGRVEIQVTLDGEAAQEFTIYLVYPHPRRGYEVMTDAEGVASFDGLPLGGHATIYGIDLFGDGLRRATPQRISLPERADELLSVELELVATTPRFGRVVDSHTAAPIARANVYTPTHPSGTDGSGRFTAYAADGDVLVVRRDGYYRALHQVQSGDDRPVIALRPILSPGGASLRGRVADEMDTPIEGARVSTTIRAIGPDGRLLGVTKRTISRCDAEGLTPPISVDLAPGETAIAELTATSPDERVAASTQVRLSSGENRVESMTLRALTKVRGRATLAMDGAPVEAVVRLLVAPGHRHDMRSLLEGYNPTSPASVRETKAGADGAFEFADVPPGPVRIAATSSFHSALVEVEIPADGLEDVQVRLSPTREVRVRAVDAEDGHSIEATLLPRPLGLAHDMVLRLPATGSTTVDVDAPRYQARQIEITPQSQAELVVALQPDL